MKVAAPRFKPAGLQLRPVHRASISDNIVDQIMALIERGDLKPGQRLPSERDLCIRFGAGRSSLREALRCLSIVGILTARIGDGTTVAADGGKFLNKILQWRMMTEQHDMENLMQVRMALEGTAAADVALHGSEEDIDNLEAFIGKMKSAVRDRKRFSTLDLDFHVTLARLSGNPLLSDLVFMIRSHLARVMERVLLPPNALPLTLKEHARIVKRIRQRDPEGARQAVSSHLYSAVARYEETRTIDAVPAKAARARISPAKKAGR